MTTARVRLETAAAFSTAFASIGLFLLLTGCAGTDGAGGTDPAAQAKGAGQNATISLSPIKLAFSATQGGSNPSGQAVAVSNAGTGKLSWSVSADAPWLAISPTSGTGAGSFTATASIAGLAAGAYSAHITISATGATNTPQIIPVSLTVTAPTTTSTIAPTATISPSSLSLSPTSLALSATQGGSNPSAAVAISNSGGGILSWSASADASWLSISPSSGTAPGSLTATASITGMAAGTYSANITVAATGATNTPQIIPVTLTVTASQPTTTSALLSWYPDPDPTVVGFFVHYGTQSPNSSGSCTYAQATYLPLSSMTASAPTATITNLLTGTTYYFAVSSYNGSIESTCSNEVLKAT